MSKTIRFSQAINALSFFIQTLLYFDLLLWLVWEGFYQKYVNVPLSMLTMKIETTRYCVHEQLFDCFTLADRFQTGHL